MCICRPEVKTPWCGKQGCETPPQNNKHDLLTDLVAEIAENRANILDYFCRAYLAESKISIKKLELVEERTETGYKWFFRIKRGRPKNVEGKEECVKPPNV